MTYVALRIIYNLWLGGTIIFMLMAFGTFIFSNKKWRKRPKIFFRRLYHSLMWPVALLSANGRKKLLTDLTEEQ